ncbi:restriction endonuclease subunit S [Streptococcus sp. 2022WUSS037]|uniref:restriction endonuclease subunit S n=1 Tax=Streptococcus sp. 2022WUSS037 TaxID=2983286 RepID=UPI0037A0885A
MPNKDRNIPKRRFKAFENADAWELRKLGEEVHFYNGRAYKQSELLDFGKYKVVRVGNFNTNEKWYYSNLELEDNKTIDTGDLVYLWATSFGPEIWKGKKSIYHYHIWKLIIKQVEKIDKNYLYTWLYQDKEKIAQNTNGSTMVHITKEMIEDRDFEFPSLPEQKAIGTFFSTLDQQITLHQRKLDKLKHVKQAYLSEMFPAEGERVPKRRFPGFTDAWELRKLGEVATRVTRKNSDLLTELALTISAQYGLIDQTEFFDKRIASKDVSGYYLVKNGEFAYNKSTSSDAPWGAVKRLDRYDMGVLSTLYIVFGISNFERVCSDFLVTYFDTNLWHKEVQAVAAEGARNHGLLNISASDFLDIALYFPKSLPEQKAIGTFFSTLDQQITLHQRKLEKLKNLKKALLNELFV